MSDIRVRQPVTIADAASPSTTATVSAAGLQVDTELPAAAALADATSNPTVPGTGSFALGYNGSTWDRLRTANTGRLQVDVITGGGVDTPTAPTIITSTTTALAAGASANADTADQSSVFKLWQVTLGGTTAFKCVISVLSNSAIVSNTSVTLTSQAGETVVFKPSHRAFMAMSSTTAGTDGFRAAFTNLDSSQAADFYASWEVATN
jgi:hypothetical protein